MSRGKSESVPGRPNYRAEDQRAYLRQSFNTRAVANGLSFLRRQYRPALLTLMALGAARPKVVAMVVREVALPVGAGLVPGLGAALLTTRLIESLLFGLTARDPATLAAAAGSLTVAVRCGGRCSTEPVE